MGQQFCIKGHNTFLVGRNKTHECKKCSYDKNNTPEMRAYHSEKRRGYHLKDLYGITLQQYNDMFVEQKGMCKICFKHQTQCSRQLNVDHDHTTEVVRGLLCDNCNKALGNVQDNIVTLKRMIEYLEVKRG